MCHKDRWREKERKKERRKQGVMSLTTIKKNFGRSLMIDHVLVMGRASIQKAPFVVASQDSSPKTPSLGTAFFLGRVADGWSILNLNREFQHHSISCLTRTSDNAPLQFQIWRVHFRPLRTLYSTAAFHSHLKQTSFSLSTLQKKTQTEKDVPVKHSTFSSAKT